MTRALVLLGCYLMGAVPFGLIIGKLTRGIDIREFGSGNIGASNVLRTLGPVPAALVMFFDTSKGLAAVLVCRGLGFGPWWVLAGGLLCVLGHVFSVFLKFQGGKGVATSLGLIIGLDPVIAAVAFGGWALLVLLTRYISVASIIAALSVPVQMYFWHHAPLAYQITAVVAALGIVLKHHSNLARLIRGTEPKFGTKVKVEKDGKLK